MFKFVVISHAHHAQEDFVEKKINCSLPWLSTPVSSAYSNCETPKQLQGYLTWHEKLSMMGENQESELPINFYSVSFDV
jgi:hypothetical protein